MNKRPVYVLTLIAAVFALTGCKTNFGAGCKKAAELTAPWSDMSLPLDEKKARVCEASADKVKLRSFEWSKKKDAAAAFEKTFTGAGYTKDRCNDMACYYVKDDARIGVQPIEFKVKKKKAVTVILTKKKSRTKAKK